VGAVTAFAGGCLGEVQRIESPIVENLRLQSVSAGAFHACAVNDDATVYCWGLNSAGQLGDETLNSKSTPVRVAGGTLRFESVTAGGAHTCALTETGDAYCWGVNVSGQLGDGNVFGQRAAPAPVIGDLEFALLSAGVGHTCGITVGGEAYCWGTEANGRLGTGSFGPEIKPLPQLVLGGLSFTMISAGLEHSCGVTTAGAAYCWGSGAFGQLGDGTTDSQTEPTAVTGGLLFSEVSAGGDFTCGITVGVGLEAYCWGTGANGQLGNGTMSGSTSPVQVEVPMGELAVFRQTSTGGGHSCALLRSVARCWGVNDAGQLGDGTTMDRSTPVDVSGGLAFRSISASISPFAAFSCGMAQDQVVYCWGSGESGQLGNGATAQQTAPVAVAGQN
jgi:alpha-tubulin suppressor-like RCC1 family protein